MAEERDIVYLAALLHDIGKFWQKGDGFWNQPNELTEQAKKLAGVASNVGQYGTPSHQHVYWTFQFIQKYAMSFQALGIKVEGVDGFSNLATFHHKPQSFLQGIITLADNWASGLDREKIGDNDGIEVTQSKESEVKWGRFQFKKMPLAKIFNRLLVNEKLVKRPESDQAVYDLSQLSLDRKLILGKPLGESPIDLTDDYNLLWKEFESEFARLPTQGYSEFVVSLSYLLKKYVWCTPADTSSLFDNSLYEHLKVTSAIALCIYDYWKAYPETLKSDKNNRLSVEDIHYPLRLWCVDLSGIQKFIYDISSKSAAKSLKGRSFYLQLLLDGISDRIIKDPKIKATLSNLIYSSGGKFFLLLPNTEDVNSALADFEIKLKKELWTEYRGSLYICFGSVAWKYSRGLGASLEHGAKNILIEGNEEPQHLSDLWSTVTKRASEQKSSRFKEILLDRKEFGYLFSGEYDKGGDAAICEVTGNEYPSDKLVRLNKDTIVSVNVKKQIELGEYLRDFRYLIRGVKGTELLPILQKVAIQKNLQVRESAHINFTPNGTSLDFLPDIGKVGSHSYGFQWYGGSDAPFTSRERGVKNFEELSGIEREERDKNNSEIKSKEGEFNRLAVLRMDVDNLGKLFTHGFEKSQASFSTYSTLSASLDWFFSGYLNTIRRKEEYKDWVNIIYSGGDDIFAVGRWDRMIDFAFDVRNDFKAFTGRDDITISGGMCIVGPRFPISKAALIAGEAEDKAKDFERDTPNGKKAKDAFCLFDVPIGWEEFQRIVDWKEKLCEWLKKDKKGRSVLSHGLLQKVFDYYEHGYLNNDLSWKWNAAYSLARQAKETSSDAKRAALNEIKNVIFIEIDKGKTFRFEAFVVACRWAELENRDLKNG